MFPSRMLSGNMWKKRMACLLYLKEKLGDLILIMEEAEKELSGHYLDAEDYLNLLTLLLPESSTLKGPKSG